MRMVRTVPVGEDEVRDRAVLLLDHPALRRAVISGDEEGGRSRTPHRQLGIGHLECFPVLRHLDRATDLGRVLINAQMSGLRGIVLQNSAGFDFGS